MAEIGGYVGRLDQRFDLVTAIGVIQFVASAWEVLGIIDGHLAPGGLVAVTVRPAIHGKKGFEGTQLRDGRFADLPWRSSTAELVSAMPGCNLLSTRLFVSDEGHGHRDLHELLLLRHH